MASYGPFEDIEVTVDNFVATVEIQRPPFNYFDYALIQQIAEAFEAFDQDSSVRSIVLCAQGKAFCAGANFGDRKRSSEILIAETISMSRRFACLKRVSL